MYTRSRGRALAILAVLACSLLAAGAQDLKSDWTFPAPNVKERYDAELKKTVYDLGDGFSAVRLKIGDAEVVLVSLPGDHPEKTVGEIEEADIALVVASKAVHLPKLMKDVRLEQEEKFEHRFRTASGGVVLVVVAHDRKTAVVRLKPVEMQ